MFVRKRRQPRAAPEPAKPPKPAKAPKPAMAPKPISWTALALLTAGSVGNLGSAPPLAVLGLASVFLYVLPALVFLVPVSLVAAELASGWPGGVYNWVSEGISAPMGLLAVWCEFAQTIFLYPALLAYVAGTLAYVFDPGLAANGVYNAVVIVVLFWAGVGMISWLDGPSEGLLLIGRQQGFLPPCTGPAAAPSTSGSVTSIWTSASPDRIRPAVASSPR